MSVTYRVQQTDVGVMYRVQQEDVGVGHQYFVPHDNANDAVKLMVLCIYK